MEISEVRVKMVSNKDDRLKAFCSMTLGNDFVVRDLKVIEGSGGGTSSVEISATSITLLFCPEGSGNICLSEIGRVASRFLSTTISEDSVIVSLSPCILQFARP